MKRKVPDAVNAATKGDAGQAVATLKRIVPDGGDATRNRDAGQIAATLKRIVPNTDDVVRYRDGTGYTFGVLEEGGLGEIIQDAI